MRLVDLKDFACLGVTQETFSNGLADLKLFFEKFEPRLLEFSARLEDFGLIAIGEGEGDAETDPDGVVEFLFERVKQLEFEVGDGFGFLELKGDFGLFDGFATKGKFFCRSFGSYP